MRGKIDTRARQLSILPFILSTLVLCVLGTGYGQVTTASIEGVVADETGAVIPGVTVTATHLDTGSKRTVLSDDGGRYHLTNLRVGRYDLQAELMGFSTQVRRGIQLTVGQQAVIDLTMKIGEISEVVSVTGEAPVINTTQATLSGVVDEKKVRDLPLNARDLLSLAPLYTGAAFSETGEQSVSKGHGTKLSISGTRYNANLFLLDGTDIGDMAGGAGSSAGLMMGVETVREFEVITNAFSAEYGNHSGGVFNAVTKSGGNAFHGSVFEFHRNDNLDARNFFDREKPEFKRNQFGATAGGPIFRDRTFFFASYEGLRESLGLTQRLVVPTVAARNGILPGRAPITVNPKIKPWMDAYPLPNSIDLGQGRAELLRSLPRAVNEDYITVRIDHRFTENNSFFGRYTWDDGVQGDPSALSFVLENLTTKQYLTLEDTHIFSPGLLNRLMVGFARTNLTSATPLLPGPELPALTFTGKRPLGRIAIFSVGGLNSLGGHSINPRLGLQNNYQFKNDISHTRGRHSLKFGAEFARWQVAHAEPFGGPGLFSFRSIAEALVGDVETFNAQFKGDDIFYNRQSYVGFYVQDDFRARPNLTLNLGLRYEFVTTPTEKYKRIANGRDYVTPGFTVDQMVVGDPYYDNPSYTGFGPRVGMAWDPWGDGKTSVRLGGGIFFDQLRPSQWSIGWDAQPPFFIRAEVNARDIPVPLSFPDAFFTQADLLLGRASTEGIEFDAKQPTVYKWALEIQRELVADTRLEIGYRATRGIHLMRVVNMNSSWPLQIRDGRIFVPAGLGILHPTMGRVRPRFTDVENDYHAFNLGVNRRLSRGFQFQASYTLSKVVSDFDAFTGSSDYNNPGSGTTKVAVPPFLFQKLDRGLANFDVRNNFFFNLTWEVPVGTGRALDLTGAANRLLGGWSLSSILRLSSGNPFSVAPGSGVFPRGRGSGLDLVAGADSNPIQPQNPDRYFDPSSFRLPPDLGFIGNLGRNTLIGPGVASLDLMLGKDFPITAIAEGFKIQFRSEFFNLLNRANFAMPRTDVFNPNRTLRSDVGRITQTRTSARQIQFGLKILW